jgi:hypothetical protein
MTSVFLLGGGYGLIRPTLLTLTVLAALSVLLANTFRSERNTAEFLEQMRAITPKQKSRGANPGHTVLATLHKSTADGTQAPLLIHGRVADPLEWLESKYLPAASRARRAALSAAPHTDRAARPARAQQLAFFNLPPPAHGHRAAASSAADDVLPPHAQQLAFFTLPHAARSAPDQLGASAMRAGALGAAAARRVSHALGCGGAVRLVRGSSSSSAAARIAPCATAAAEFAALAAAPPAPRHPDAGTVASAARTDLPAAQFRHARAGADPASAADDAFLARPAPAQQPPPRTRLSAAYAGVQAGAAGPDTASAADDAFLATASPDPAQLAGRAAAPSQPPLPSAPAAALGQADAADAAFLAARRAPIARPQPWRPQGRADATDAAFRAAAAEDES